jgi:small-conductance mechanosensitive channel
VENETLKTFFESFSLFRILVALLFFFLTWGFLWGMRLLSEVLASKFARYRLFISSAYPVLRLFVWLGALTFAIFAIFNPPFNTIIAISASAGLAVGLGAQDLIKNVIAGILILMDRPFRVGDMIQVGDHYGEVTNIGLRSTRVHTFDDSSVTLPNSLVLGVAVANSNSGALDEMVVVEFHLPANTDVQLVKELAREAAACSPYVYLKKPIAVLIDDRFDRTFLTRLKIKAYVLDVRLERLLASDISERLKGELLKRGLMTEALVRGVAAGN